MAIENPQIDGLGTGDVKMSNSGTRVISSVMSRIAPILVLPVKGTFSFKDVKSFDLTKSSRSVCGQNYNADDTHTIGRVCHLYGWGTETNPDNTSTFNPRWKQASDRTEIPKNPRDVIYMYTPARLNGGGGGLPGRGVYWAANRKSSKATCSRSSDYRITADCRYRGWVGKIDFTKSLFANKRNLRPMIHLSNNPQTHPDIPSDIRRDELNKNIKLLRITDDQDIYNKNILSNFAYEAPPTSGTNITRNQPSVIFDRINNKKFTTASVYLDTIYTSWFFPGFINGIKDLSGRTELKNYLQDFRRTNLVNDIILKDYIANYSVIYAIVSQFYTQLYQFGPYLNNKNNNDFHNKRNVYLPENLKQFKDDFIRVNVSYYNSVLSETFKNKINTLLNNFLQFPKITKKDEYFYIKLYFPSHISTKFTSPHLDWSNTINQFFDTKSNGIKLQNPGNNDFFYWRGFSRDGNVSLDMSSRVPAPNNPFELHQDSIGLTTDLYFTTVSFNFKVLEPSVMFIAYALLNSQEIHPTHLGDMSKQFGLLPLGLINDATPVDTIKSTLTRFCVQDSVLNGFALTRSEMQNLFMNRNSKYCTCYMNSVSPPDTQHPDKVGQCFSRSCDDDIMRKAFNLNNDDCKANCKQACFWMNNKNPTQQPSNKADFNESRYYNICGERCEFQIGEAELFNKKVLLSLSILGIVIIFYLFILLKNKNYSTSKVIFILSTFLILYVPILLFLSNFFSGYSLCADLGEDSICFRNDTFIDNLFNIKNRRIPNEFCSDKWNCECFIDNDCGDTEKFECRSSTCIRKEGPNRETYTTKYRNISIFDITIGIIFIVFIILIFSQLRKHTDNKKILSILYFIFEIGLILGVSIYLGYSNLKLHNRDNLKPL